MDTPDPFLFCVYHKDMYPAGNAKCEAPRIGNGADFDPGADYRMYHGEKVPGFPQHPHRGFETITATLTGVIDHTDSLGNAGRYGHGDLNWMTAGKGIVHGEMFPLVNDDRPNALKFFQIWINLPAADKMAEPTFTMHWAPQVTRFSTDDGLASVIVWAGTVDGHVAPAPPAVSYAAKPANSVGVVHLTLQPGGEFALRALPSGCKRSVYFLEGSTATLSGTAAQVKTIITCTAHRDVVFNNTGADVAELLVLEGKPIGEPVTQHGPFVMNTQQEIQQAFADYRRTQFGGWPWPEDAMVFPRKKARFALQAGVETAPPDGAEGAGGDSSATDSATAFPVGSEVEVFGLANAQELNGKTGTVVAPPMPLADGRVAVVIGGAAKATSIREANLRRL